jgi:hypothetical protein
MHHQLKVKERYFFAFTKYLSNVNACQPRRNRLYADGLFTDLSGFNNLYESFLQGVKDSKGFSSESTFAYQNLSPCLKLGKGNCLGTRKSPNGDVGDYTWQTYDEVHKRIKSFGFENFARNVYTNGITGIFSSGLSHLGAKKKDNIGLFSINRPEWVRSMLLV